MIEGWLSVYESRSLAEQFRWGVWLLIGLFVVAFFLPPMIDALQGVFDDEALDEPPTVPHDVALTDDDAENDRRVFEAMKSIERLR